MDKTSMLYWWPKIKGLKIPMPETEIILCKENLSDILNETEADLFTEQGLRAHIDIPAVEKACEKLGYPVFIRSDATSHKHNWEKSCYLTKKEDIVPHLIDISSFSASCDIFGGIPFNAVIVRKYIPMDNLFTAFSGRMPVNPEWRIFIKDHKLLCAHWYWVEDAIQTPSIMNWKAKMQKAKEAKDNATSGIDGYASMVATVFDGCWSVDFCKAADGEWQLIDMAEGFKSWHPEECHNHKAVKDIRL